MERTQSVEMPLLDMPANIRPSRPSFIKLVKFYILDWIMVLVLIGIFYAFHVVRPFHRFVGKYTMDDLRYPMKSSPTVPFFCIPLVSLGAPLMVILGFYWYRRDIRDLHHALLGLAFSVALAGAITNVVKDAVGRPRPDYFWRCFPDGKENYSPIGEVICTGDKNTIIQGHKSFPSGHASWCFSALGYLSLYLAGKLQIFNRQGHIWRSVVAFLPLATATYIGITRIADYKHHWEDVFAAAIIGMTCATLCYRQHFPPLADVNYREAYGEMTLEQMSMKDQQNLTETSNV